MAVSPSVGERAPGTAKAALVAQVRGEATSQKVAEAALAAQAGEEAASQDCRQDLQEPKPGIYLRATRWEDQWCSDRRFQSCRMPWEQGSIRWSSLRTTVCRLVYNPGFEGLVVFLVAASCACLALETDAEAKCWPTFAHQLDECPWLGAQGLPWIGAANRLLVVPFALELAARLLVERCAFFLSPWRNLELTVVAAGLASCLPIDPVLLRFCRTVRFAMVLRPFIFSQHLNLLLRGLAASARTILWGSVMLLCLLFFWSALLVELVHPFTSMLDDPPPCERCARGYSSVMASMLTCLEQLITGDGWSKIAAPLAEEEPWTAFFTVGAVVTIVVALASIAVEMVVDRFVEAREDAKQRPGIFASASFPKLPTWSRQEPRQQEELEFDQKGALLQIFREMDHAHHGSVSFQEISHAYDHLDEFRGVLDKVGIRRDDMRSIFGFLDQGQCGHVDYKELCDELHRMSTTDTGMMLAILKLAMSELREETSNGLRAMAKQLGQHAEVLGHVEHALSSPRECDPGALLAAGKQVGPRRVTIGTVCVVGDSWPLNDGATTQPPSPRAAGLAEAEAAAAPRDLSASLAKGSCSQAWEDNSGTTASMPDGLHTNLSVTTMAQEWAPAGPAEAPSLKEMVRQRLELLRHDLDELLSESTTDDQAAYSALETASASARQEEEEDPDLPYHLFLPEVEEEEEEELQPEPRTPTAEAAGVEKVEASEACAAAGDTGAGGGFGAPLQMGKSAAAGGQQGTSSGAGRQHPDAYWRAEAVESSRV